MKNIILLGEPKSTSHVYQYTCRGRFACMYMTKKGKDVKESYQWQIKSQWKDKPLTENLKVSLVLYFGTKRKQDIDNFNKLALDACTGTVWEDDSQIQEMTIRKEYDKENPRIELSIANLLRPQKLFK